ncbi:MULTISPECIES: M55 family metallopeptidase [Aminobacter]|jgi:D-amino peptidase|uniref:D-amino peptidase n=2 Tax=Aminobacter TaxID=31988 RepID=A0AAC8YK61_AMIAI|nr:MULTISPECIES: M55 family metallopeptidase [Aminobacter]AMS39594.1 peptide ABC transporter [Aminobacter aminovorans]MBA8907421.1 D-amino peptidase [Aminobacter ciceronei]MBA9021194.1 D-amino peptidase [Aminobacter ciceronei]MBB3708295.1 D-amino peptidase [Aminobacter aminovorans]MRX33694.1 peptide ABC transporter [Aminobacter sp. MDW-2]
MKVFISADIEGTAGITVWDEARKGHAAYEEFREYMTDELVAACEGAKAAGAKEVLVKDAHSTGRNLILSKLPAYVTIVRDWSGHPDMMMFGIDDSFSAALYTGYHNKAGTDTNPLAHTLTGTVSRLLINGEVASEYTLNALCAARYGVPSVFLSGDAGMCAEAKLLVPRIGTVATSEGFGPATRSLTPKASVAAIRAGVEEALSRDLKSCLPKLADSFELVVEYTNPHEAYRVSWYPGVEHPAPRTLRFRASDFFEIQRAIRFIV